jgi:uncharacterized membrane-anchored protein
MLVLVADGYWQQAELLGKRSARRDGTALTGLQAVNMSRVLRVHHRDIAVLNHVHLGQTTSALMLENTVCALV